MSKSAVPYRREQEKVNAHFQSQSSYWRDIYADKSVQAEIYRARQARALSWIESLGLVPGSRVLEIGCGAGYMAIALAQRGLRVHAIDSTEAMVELARQHAAETGTTEQLSVEVGDVYALAFEEGSFELVTAIGVIPWLAQPELAIQEMARVTKPGGHIIFTVANRAGLPTLLDPLRNPALSPLKRRVKHMLERAGLRHPVPEEMQGAAVTSHMYERQFIDEMLASTGLMKTRGLTLGFGPFSLLRHKLLPEPIGIALHHQLQRLADRNVPFFSSTGMSYLVLAGKSAIRPPERSTSAGKPASDALSDDTF